MYHLLSLLLLVITSCAVDWSPVDSLLQQGIQNKIYPAAHGLVYSKTKGLIYDKTFGYFSYGEPLPYNPVPPKVTQTAIWDMASCTKVIATTSAVAQFYERGELPLDLPLSHPSLLGSSFAQSGKDKITARHVLTHSSGFPPILSLTSCPRTLAVQLPVTLLPLKPSLVFLRSTLLS
ncbi:hypothetical protein GEMRC1_001030 [Eukaryota sp. GEM-RC1]